VEGPDGVILGAEIGTTDRGSLWRASRDSENDRIIRIVDPRFCDERFRRALKHLRERHPPRTLEIVGEGWLGAHYYIEYAVDGRWSTLGELLAERPQWTDRLLLLMKACDALALWKHSPLLPAGLSAHNIVMVIDDGGDPAPWFVPCPAVNLSAPSDLIGIDPMVLAAIAPETVRGVQLDQRAQDRYALGTLAAQAIGCRVSRLALDDEGLVEAQARGALLVATTARSDIKPFLYGTPQIEHLLSVIRRHRHTSPAARPVNAEDLRSALAAGADLIGLARTLRSTDPSGAVEVLSWSNTDNRGYHLSCLRLAAEICAEHGDRLGTLRYLDQAIGFAPNQRDLRRWRCDELSSLAGEEGWSPDRDEDLLDDVRVLKRLDLSKDPMWYLRAADVYRRRGDHEREAQELYEAVQRDGGDLDSLKLYVSCWIKLGDRTSASAVRQVARQRIKTKVLAGLLSERAGEKWNQEFDELLG
jgi:hypothetical protein